MNELKVKIFEQNFNLYSSDLFKYTLMVSCM